MAISAAGRWIGIEEAKPGPFETVLVWRSDDGEGIEQWDGERWLSVDGLAGDETITHWASIHQPEDADPVPPRTWENRQSEDIRLLGATIRELRDALPRCGYNGCKKIVTWEHYDEYRCDVHVEKGHSYTRIEDFGETPWAPVARRLGW